MSSQGSKSPSPSRHPYRSSRVSPRRRSRSPIHPHSPSSRMSRASLSKGSRDAEHLSRNRERRSSPHASKLYGNSSHRMNISELGNSSSIERHNPGPLEPLPSDAEQKKVQISVRNPSADLNSPLNGSISIPVEEIQIPRRMGEGKNPIFGFLGHFWRDRRVVLVDKSPTEVKQESSRPHHSRDCHSSETRDSQTSSSHRCSRSCEPSHSRSDRERERLPSSGRGIDRNGERNNRRGDVYERLRRDDRREDKRDLHFRDRERNRNEDKGHVEDREKGGGKEKGHAVAESSKSSENVVESTSSNVSNNPQTRPPVQFMNRGVQRPRLPMYPLPRPPPFMPRGPMPPMHFLPRNMPPPMFGPPPFFPPRMPGPRPRF